jgi:hypothetical protein
MNWLFESPLTILTASVAIGFFLGVAWMQTGRNAFLYGIGGLVLVAALLLALERYIETDKENVTRLLYELAHSIEANDAETVASHIVSTRPDLRKRAKDEMARHRFDQVTVTKIYEVDEEPQHQPPQIVVDFTVLVGGSFFNNSAVVSARPVYFHLYFWKDVDGQWRVANYEYDPDRPFPRASGRTYTAPSPGGT